MNINNSIRQISNTMYSLYDNEFPVDHIITEGVDYIPEYSTHTPLLESQVNALNALGEVRGKLLKNVSNINWKGFIESIKSALGNIKKWIMNSVRTMADLITGKQTLLGLIKRLRDKKSEAKAGKNKEAEHAMDEAIKGADNVIDLVDERIKRVKKSDDPSKNENDNIEPKVVEYQVRILREFNSMVSDLTHMATISSRYVSEIENERITPSAAASFKLQTDIIDLILRNVDLIYKTYKISDADKFQKDKDYRESLISTYESCVKRFDQIKSVMPNVRLAIKVSKSQKK